MGKFFTFVVLIAGLVATFFVLKDHFAEQRVKTNPWMGQMRNLLEDQAKSRDLLNVENPWYAEEGTFYKLLSLMYEANRDKYDPEETLATACNGTVNPALAKLIVESMIGNFTLAKQMGVFEETTNILQLENGSAPVAAATTAATADDMQRSRAAVQKASKPAELERMQSITEQRLKSGFYTPAQADELLNLINGKLDWLASEPEDKGTDFTHEAAEHEVTA